MLSESPTEQESRVVSDHYSYLKELMEQGTVILAGRTQNTDYSSFGIVIFRAESLEQARKIVENDPAVKDMVMRPSSIPTGLRCSILATRSSNGRVMDPRGKPNRA